MSTHRYVRTGSEPIRCRGSQQDRTYGDFWAWLASDLLDNAMRGILAEYLVAVALGVDSTPRVEWDHTDVRWDGVKIEVKATGMVQTWDDRIAVPTKRKIEFRIPMTKGWDADTGATGSVPMRPSDCYVFAVHEDEDLDTADPADTDRWGFYVMSTPLVDEVFTTQKTVTLSRVRQFAEPVAFCGLREAIAVATEHVTRDHSSAYAPDSAT